MEFRLVQGGSLFTYALKVSGKAIGPPTAILAACPVNCCGCCGKHLRKMLQWLPEKEQTANQLRTRRLQLVSEATYLQTCLASRGHAEHQHIRLATRQDSTVQAWQRGLRACFWPAGRCLKQQEQVLEGIGRSLTLSSPILALAFAHGTSTALAHKHILFPET